MRNSTASNTAKYNLYIIGGAIVCIALLLVSLFIGKFPLSLDKLLNGDELQIKVFWTLRFSRAVVGCVGGIALGIAGYIFQTVFRNQLASPDIIGVSSGASAGAAAGILFFSGAAVVTLCAFGGALIAVALAIAFSAIDKSGRKSTVVLAGIAVHSLAQTCLMFMKLIADPEKQLASIEYWIMGSLNGINSYSIGGNITLCISCIVLLLLLHRQTLLLSADEGEAKLLGVNVPVLRLIVLVIATLTVASVVSLTGLISFVGLISPHCARKIMGNNNRKTMLLSGFIGGCVLILADILARTVADTEVPVSIFTSLIGAPFLIILIAGRRDSV